MDGAVSIPGERGWFRRRVREEARATWGGRFRWLWRIAALGALGFAALAPKPGFEEPGFGVMCALAFWVPGWLGADLLAIRFRGNPDPLREWSPAEFLARAIGRLGPFLAAETVWLAVFCGRPLIDDLTTQGPNNLSGAGFHPLGQLVWGNLWLWWAAWVLVFVASGLPYCAAAALMSATARRPRALLVTPLVLVVGSTLVCLLVDAKPIMGSSMNWPEFFAKPQLLSFQVGMGSAQWLIDHGQGVLTRSDRIEFPELCALASEAFLAYMVVLALPVWYVAERRHRRHPSAGRRTVEETSVSEPPLVEGLPA
jgi:hypothetical protein